MKRDRSNIVTITAYDQIRYLKNKDTLVYENKTADGVVALIGEKYGFNIGTLANTVWVIASRVEDNVSLLDMISNALDQTLQNTGDLYILHDDFGKLNLSFLGDMYVPIMIDAEMARIMTMSLPSMKIPITGSNWFMTMRMPGSGRFISHRIHPISTGGGFYSILMRCKREKTGRQRRTRYYSFTIRRRGR